MAFRADAELTRICSQLWDADTNRAEPGKDYEIDLQGGTKSYWSSDKADRPLFKFVRSDLLKCPTYASFIALLDNYEAATGQSEVVTQEEIVEMRTFIDCICETKVIQMAHQYLVQKGKAQRDMRSFKRQLYDLWFKLYRRTRGSRALDSSAFEHVFVGETRGGSEVLGFHNWIQFYLQEKAGNVDYQGYILGTKSDLGDKSRLITIKFKWNRETKPMGSSFIGTSPEFEIALYTICFLCNPRDETTEITVADYDVVITCYKHGLNLGTSYPKVV